MDRASPGGIIRIAVMSDNAAAQAKKKRRKGMTPRSQRCRQWRGKGSQMRRHYYYSSFEGSRSLSLMLGRGCSHCCWVQEKLVRWVVRLPLQSCLDKVINMRYGVDQSCRQTSIFHELWHRAFPLSHSHKQHRTFPSSRFGVS